MHFNQRELERVRSRQRPEGSGPGQVGVGVVHFWRGRWREALATFEEVTKGEAAGTCSMELDLRSRMLARAYMGEREGGAGRAAPEGAG